MIAPADLVRLVDELPREQLPAFIGELEAVKAKAWLRLQMPPVEQPKSAAETSRVTADVIAERYGVPRSWVYELSRQGRIPCQRLGRYVRFDPEAVERALADGVDSKRDKLGATKRPLNSKGSERPATALLPRQPADSAPGARNG